MSFYEKIPIRDFEFSNVFPVCGLCTEDFEFSKVSPCVWPCTGDFEFSNVFSVYGLCTRRQREREVLVKLIVC